MVDSNFSKIPLNPKIKIKLQDMADWHRFHVINFARNVVRSLFGYCASYISSITKLSLLHGASFQFDLNLYAVQMKDVNNSANSMHKNL